VDLALLDVRPRVLNRASRGLVQIVLQPPPDLDARRILLESLTLNGSPPPEPLGVSYRDGNGDGIDELVLRLSRQALMELLGEERRAILTVSGEIDGAAWFQGTTTLRLVGRGGPARGGE
jgi:hypothetical protein